MNVHFAPPTSRHDVLLHRRVITLVSQSQVSNPPHGVFDWNYIQCVLKKFAKDDYKGLTNINHFVFPFPTRDDDDHPEFDDPGNIEDPPYPSFLLDLAWTRQCRELEEVERHQDIEKWRSVINHGKALNHKVGNSIYTSSIP